MQSIKQALRAKRHVLLFFTKERYRWASACRLSESRSRLRLLLGNCSRTIRDDSQATRGRKFDRAGNRHPD